MVRRCVNSYLLLMLVVFHFSHLKINISTQLDAKTVIEYIFKQIVQFKKLNHEELEKGKKSKPSTPVGGIVDVGTPLTNFLE